MAGTDIVTHYLEPFDKHKKYYDFMARAFDASNAYPTSSECLPEDTECLQYADADAATQEHPDCQPKCENIPYTGFGSLQKLSCYTSKVVANCGGSTDFQKELGDNPNRQNDLTPSGQAHNYMENKPVNTKAAAGPLGSMFGIPIYVIIAVVVLIILIKRR